MLAAALALAEFVPGIVGLFAGPKAGAVAEKVVGIAQAVTGKASPDEALAALKANPDLVLQFQKAVLDQKVQLEQIAAQRARDEAQADLDADNAMTERMAKLEGTAADLKGIPFFGPLMLFLRGSQRIVIGYGTAYLDYEWFTGGLGTLNDAQSRLMVAASLLVFIVVFGERAVRNVAPLIEGIFRARSGS